MDASKPTRAQRMAETYEAILIRSGAMKPKRQPADPLRDVKDRLAREEINWWQICLGQTHAKK